VDENGIAFMEFGFVVARFGLFLREVAVRNNATGGRADSRLFAPSRHHRYIKALDRGQFRQAYGQGFA
jgi:hypothetical protein